MPRLANFKRPKIAIDTFHEEAIDTLATAGHPAGRKLRQLIDPLAVAEESIRATIDSRRDAVARQYIWVNHRLYRRTKDVEECRQVIQKGETLQLLQECHNHLLSGHQGVSRTFQRVGCHGSASGLNI
ncbi:uncharacterized protein BYT42DRAFT_613935 [Radiomyces spectabilis]|uniref:uncharacterized protein n=1 Tax=Radiomyces spectabilis TaxID=64574 RepID=UPI00221F2BB0|nr:uncharacterized protein BYT42DRAFT_613935 [Radiomyces spectabilis]KAI8379648.1 hypothetical protein BYT42DRAFT_613935 [Radiomyces spectabilis]